MIAPIKNEFGNDSFVNNINDKSCVVHLEGIPTDRAILDLDKFHSYKKIGYKRCDYVLFFELGNNIICVLIELKSGRFSLSHVIDQLQSTANLINSYLQFQMICCPLLLHRGRFKTADLLRFRKQRIIFQTSVSVIRGTCGVDKNVYSPIKKRLDELGIFI